MPDEDFTLGEAQRALHRIDEQLSAMHRQVEEGFRRISDQLAALPALFVTRTEWATWLETYRTEKAVMEAAHRERTDRICERVAALEARASTWTQRVGWVLSPLIAGIALLVALLP